MAVQRSKGTATKPKAPAAKPQIDQDALSLEQAAKGVLARKFRPRVSTVRRLAEAVLSAEEEAKKAGKKKKKKPSDKKSAKSSDKKSGKSSRGKKRKLAKIPGQKGKKTG